ncbi:glycosyltransferase family 4 protein [Paracoccus sp. 1_MG-2023]|uniref:glycosyltransferase family 4 protein n=1 Tax=unclassified Paracoccus (in: a-proteobacteria) TaxID=2688777 RepID=UPI001C0A1779|nr:MULTISPECIES: glycosyltransferase family 4 protein [unclassified Paracoccus (in: a-proteobacteria)]MBU2958929.1 glycosyltransferase family 4 protein [Paracoccus sp. C2R09]MDO6669981.1 glycosyltransferase family 4 protein [Paracoccus sp. 1_MG-2023]
MKISFALPELGNRSGGLRVVAQYARHLLDQGHEVRLVVRRPRHMPGPRRRLLGRLGLGPLAPPLAASRGHFSDLDVPIHHLEETRPLRVGDVPDADIIVSTWWTTAEWANTLPPAKGRHVHFVQDYEDFYPEFSRRVRAVYGLDIPKIVVAPWLQRRLVQEFGRDSRVVMNGVDLDHFATPSRAKSSPPKVGFMYAEHPRKNSGMALDVVRRIQARRPDIECLCFGAEARPAAASAAIRYERKPSQDRIPQIYRSCDLWLFVSRSEGYGLPLLEAAASRTPILATPAGAAPDLIDGRNGEIASFVPQEFAQAALRILDEPDAAWADRSAAAFETAQSHSLGIAARAFEAELTQLA